MEYISSDTNVWIDFAAIGRLHLPFLLAYVYIMYYEQIEQELSETDKAQLLANGLKSVDITLDEFYLAEKYGTIFLRLSKWDRITLAIAKKRNIKLLTGDRALRNAAAKENVETIGTIGIIDELRKQELIDKQEYKKCIEELIKQNGKKVRLPAQELLKRLRGLRAEG